MTNEVSNTLYNWGITILNEITKFHDNLYYQSNLKVDYIYHSRITSFRCHWRNSNFYHSRIKWQPQNDPNRFPRLWILEDYIVIIFHEYIMVNLSSIPTEIRYFTDIKYALQIFCFDLMNENFDSQLQAWWLNHFVLNSWKRETDDASFIEW